MRKKIWTETQLVSAVKDSTSYRQIIKKLNLVPTGGNYNQIKKYIDKLKINITHLKGHAWNKGMTGITRSSTTPLEKILINGSTYQSFKLKKRLFASNIKPKYCEICKWSQKTTDGYLPLELDHINGNKNDNRLENLRVLCPNCHSLQPTHRGRNIKHKKQ